MMDNPSRRRMKDGPLQEKTLRLGNKSGGSRGLRMLDLQGHGGCPALSNSDQRKGPGHHPTKINPYSDEKGHLLMLFKEAGLTRTEGRSQEECQQAPCTSGQCKPRGAEGALLARATYRPPTNSFSCHSSSQFTW